MYEKKSYKIMVAFDILTDIDYIDQFEQIDNNNKSWYESFNQFLTNKIYYNIKQEV